MNNFMDEFIRLSHYSGCFQTLIYALVSSGVTVIFQPESLMFDSKILGY